MNKDFFVNIGTKELLKNGPMTCLHSLSIIPNDGEEHINIFPSFCQTAGEYEEVRATLHRHIDDLFDAAQCKGKYAK